MAARTNLVPTATVSGTNVAYTYDGLDTWVEEVTGGVMTNYVRDRAGGLPLLVSDGTKNYLHAGGILAEVGSTGTRLDHLTDALGSVRGVTDAAGAVAATTNYAAFGSVRAATGTQSGFGCTGEQRIGEAPESRDVASGLHTAAAIRYASPPPQFTQVVAHDQAGDEGDADEQRPAEELDH